jgi:hypothetical protein
MDPKQILELAKKEEKVESEFCASDYIEAIIALRNKGFSYPSIAKWLHDRGVSFSVPSLRSAYYNSINRMEEKEEDKKLKK